MNFQYREPGPLEGDLEHVQILIDVYTIPAYSLVEHVQLLRHGEMFWNNTGYLAAKNALVDCWPSSGQLLSPASLIGCWCLVIWSRHRPCLLACRLFWPRRWRLV